MGESAEKMAKVNGIRREEQDLIALASAPSNAAAAIDDGRLTAERCTVRCRPRFDTAVDRDNGAPDTTLEALATLSPVFDRRRHRHRRQRVAAHRRRQRRAAHVRGARDRLQPLGFMRYWASPRSIPAGSS